MKSAWTATWKIGLFVAIWGLLSAPAPFVFGLAAAEPGAPISPSDRLLLEAWGAVAVLVAAWIMTTRVDRRRFRELGFEPEPVPRDTLAGLALGAGMIATAVLVLWAAGWARFASSPVLQPATLAMLAGALFLNAVTQEVLIRGYALQAIEAVSNVRVALLVSSILFTLLHAGAIVEGGLLPAVNLFAAGILLGVAYTSTRNLWLPFGLHFSWNFLQGPVLGLGVTGADLTSGLELIRLDGPRLLTGGPFGLEGGLVGTLVTVLAILLLVSRSRSHMSSTNGGEGA